MKAAERIWRVLQTILLVLLSLILVSNLWMLGAKHLFHVENPTLFGVTWAVVLTGSMEPAISGNDMVVTRAQEDYAVGDIIMFESGSILVTHRIVEKTGEGFITRGDANNTADQHPVRAEQIVGRVVWVVPGVGAAVRWLKTPLGLLAVLLLGFLGIEIPYLLEKRKT